jgi:hypothetical protein
VTTQARREHYRREGWVVVPGLLSAAAVEDLLRATDALCRAAAGLRRDAVVLGVDYRVQSASGRAGEPAARPGALRKITFPSKAQAAFLRLRSDARLLAVLADLGLPAPRCLVDQVNLKLPGIGTAFPFHQDAPFLIEKTREQIDRHGGANCVVALDAADRENGTFEVLGRTHQGGVVAFDYDLAGTNEGVFDETRRVALPLEPGDAVVFHPHLAHGSGPNPSERPRRIVTLWFSGGDPSEPPRPDRPGRKRRASARRPGAAGDPAREAGAQGT